MIKILLVDDHPSVRIGLRMRFGLEPDLHIVGEAGDGLAAISMATALNPNIILMDLEMPTLDGIAATHSLHCASSSSAVVILTAHDTPDRRTQAKAAGAAAFMSKTGYVDKLIDVIRAVATGTAAIQTQHA